VADSKTILAACCLSCQQVSSFKPDATSSGQLTSEAVVKLNDEDGLRDSSPSIPQRDGGDGEGVALRRVSGGRRTRDAGVQLEQFMLELNPGMYDWGM